MTTHYQAILQHATDMEAEHAVTLADYAQTIDRLRAEVVTLRAEIVTAKTEHAAHLSRVAQALHAGGS